jgi:hypothetical protein
MKSKILLSILILFFTSSANSQEVQKKYYWAGELEFIPPLFDVKVGRVLRFSGFYNAQEQFHYNFSPHLGFYTGFGIRNVGFINKLNDSIKVKQRVYSAGIPLALKIGNMEKSAYIALGGELELFFNYKQKTFYKDTKSKFNEWFSDRTDLLNSSVFLEIKGKRGGFIRFKYYINDFLKGEKQTVTVNGFDYPYYPSKSKLFYVSIGSVLNNKAIKSKRSFREKKA